MNVLPPDRIDLSQLTIEELQAFIAKIEQVLAVRRFEEGLTRAIREYQSRDPHVIRF